MSQSDDRSHSGDPVGVLEAAERVRKPLRKKPIGDGGPEAMPDTLFDAVVGHDDDTATTPPDDVGTARKKAARKVLADADKADHKPGAVKAKPAAKPLPKDGAGLVTKGVHAGLRGMALTGTVGRRLGLWGGAAVAALCMVLVLSVSARETPPAPAKVTGVRITYLPGPRLADRELLGLVWRYPHLRNLEYPDSAALGALAEWLRQQSVVREVSQVQAVHEADGKRRLIEIVIGLRSPVLPAVLANGARAWVDSQGRLLPGILPAPVGNPRPIVRAIEQGGAERLHEALWLWQTLESQLDAGLLTDIHLDDDLDLKGQKGIVLYTRNGSRLVWGLPGDVKFGVERERKACDLVHTIRCQGDLTRIASINVRFKKPYFTLR